MSDYPVAVYHRDQFEVRAVAVRCTCDEDLDGHGVVRIQLLPKTTRARLTDVRGEEDRAKALRERAIAWAPASRAPAGNDGDEHQRNNNGDKRYWQVPYE